MDRKSIKANNQQKELEWQLNIMAAFGSNGFGLIPSAKLNKENEDAQAKIEHLTE